MKSIFTTFVFLCILSNFIFGQKIHLEGECGTPEFRISTVHHLLGNKDRAISDTSTLYIPITFNIVGSDNGGGYYPVGKALDAMCKLQTDFDLYNFHFYIENCNYIDDTDFYNMSPYPGYAFSEDMYDFIEAHNTENTMNVYIVKHCGGPSGLVSFEDFADWDYSIYPPPWIHTQNQAIILDKDFLEYKNHLFTHEVGHFFGLYHTFYGDWGDFQVNGTPDTVYYDVTDPSNNQTQTLPWLVERVDDSTTCNIAGDLICDTPPDYLGNYGGWGCNQDQESFIVQLDPDTVEFQSDGSLYMSYSNENCQDRFSPQQVEVMRIIAQSDSARSYLLYNQMPPDEIDSSTLIMTYPPNGETIAIVDSITLEWNMPGIDLYLVEFGIIGSGGIHIEIYSGAIYNENILKVKVSLGKDYYWIVRGVHNYYPCEVWQDTSYFVTDEIVGIKELADLNSIILFPNPVKDELHLHFSKALQSSETLEISLFDAQGRFVSYHQIQLGQAINTEYLAEGMYFLKAVVGDEIYTGKFVKH